MLDEMETKLIKKLNYIPNHLLAKYLEGKLLVKPDYPSEMNGGEVKSRYEEYKANIKATQKEANKVANPKRRY